MAEKVQVFLPKGGKVTFAGISLELPQEVLFSVTRAERDHINKHLANVDVCETVQQKGLVQGLKEKSEDNFSKMMDKLRSE